MIKRLRALGARIDALSMRERMLVFVALAAVIVFAAWIGGLGPLLNRQAELRAKISQQQNNLAGMDTEIAQKIKEYQNDPDAAVRDRLKAVNAESAQLSENLRAMQKGLVAPERMGPLIDKILRANGRLKLVSMRTLAVTSLNEPPPAEAQAIKQPDPKAAPKDETQAKLASINAALDAQHKSLKAAAAVAANGVPPPAAPVPAPAAAPAPAPVPAAAPAPAIVPKPGSLLYRHGVEITVRGNYLDMIDYMAALEGLPTQLFWGGAKLEVEDYPTSRLTLTMYTLSLDPKWLKL